MFFVQLQHKIFDKNVDLFKLSRKNLVIECKNAAKQWLTTSAFFTNFFSKNWRILQKTGISSKKMFYRLFKREKSTLKTIHF